MQNRDVSKNLNFKAQSNCFDAIAMGKKIAEGYLSQKREDEHKSKVSFAPSSIGGYNGLCPRYWYLAFGGADFQESNDALSLAIMSNGSFGHTRIENAIEAAGILVDKEREMEMQDPPIRGYIDAIVLWDEEEVVCEIKTIKQEKFVHRQAEMKADPQHRIQLLIYMHSEGARKGFLLYENKNTQNFIIIPIEMDDKNTKLIADVLEWLRMVKKNYDEGMLPERPWTRTNINCTYCPLQVDCWENRPDGEIKIKPMRVVKV